MDRLGAWVELRAYIDVKYRLAGHWAFRGRQYTVLHDRPDLHTIHLRIFERYVLTLPSFLALHEHFQLDLAERAQAMQLNMDLKSRGPSHLC